MPRRPAFAAAVLAVAMSGIAAGATAAVYKCTGPGGVPLYTDLPCKGGSLVDIRPGTADPAAIAKLAREEDRFAALALARAQLADEDDVDAVGASRESSAAGGYGPDEGGPGIASGSGVVYVPIFVSPRRAFHRVHEHRHWPHRFARHRGGPTGATMPVPRGMTVTRSREREPALHVTAMAWK